MKALGVAVVGCGVMGSQHAVHWSQREDAEVVAVSDVDGDRCAALAQKHGAKPYASWEQVLADPAVQVVSVCVPACFHAPVSIAAARAGRHVLCEKPMALSLDEADAMIAAAAENRVQLVVSHQVRGQGRAQVIKALVDDGALAGPLLWRFTDCREVRPKTAMHSRSLSGGPIHDMAGHFVDLVHYCTGALVTEAYASGHVLGDDKARLASVADHAVDAADIHLRWTDGHICTMQFHWGLPEGTPGFTNATVSGRRAMVLLGSDPTVEVLDSSGRRTIEEPRAPDGPAVRIDDLMQAITSGGPPQVDGQAGRHAIAATLAALSSIAEGRAVRL